MALPRSARRRPLIPDPHGFVGLALIVGVLFFHLFAVTGGRGCLVSENLVLEVGAHAWLLLGPPLAVYLGLRHLWRDGTSLLPLLTVPLAGFLTLLTAVGIGVALLAF